MDNYAHECWGPWEDEGPYYVKADRRTIEEAAAILQSQGFEEYAILAQNAEVISQKVWDCPYDGEKPCDEPNCKHDHIENVYQFYVYYPHEISDSDDVVLMPQEAQHG